MMPLGAPETRGIHYHWPHYISTLILVYMYENVFIHIYIWYPPPQRSTKINAITDIEFGRSLGRGGNLPRGLLAESWIPIETD